MYRSLCARFLASGWVLYFRKNHCFHYEMIRLMNSFFFVINVKLQLVVIVCCFFSVATCVFHLLRTRHQSVCLIIIIKALQQQRLSAHSYTTFISWKLRINLLLSSTKLEKNKRELFLLSIENLIFVLESIESMLKPTFAKILSFNVLCLSLGQPQLKIMWYSISM